MKPGRKALPHQIPLWVDSSRAVWFVTMACRQRGSDQLTPLADPLMDTVRFRHDSRKWFVHIFLIMPDHCHALLSFPQEGQLAETIRQWKRWTATSLGVAWQTDFFDHRLRNAESYAEKFRYILENPVRAGLVARAQDWPHVWGAEL